MSLLSAVMAQIVRAGGGGGGGGEPNGWESFVATSPITLSSSHVANIPATVASGDLLVVVVSVSNSATAGGFTGWTSVANNLGAATRLSVLFKIADGTEGGESVAYTTSADRVPSAFVFRFLAGTFNATDPLEVSTANTGSSDTPIPPSLALPWGAVNSFVMAIAGTTNTVLEAYVSYAYPDYQTFTQAASGSGTGFATAMTAGAMEASGTATPGNFRTEGRSRAWTAITMGVRPPA